MASFASLRRRPAARRLLSALFALLVTAWSPLAADEGMWTFDNVPRAQLKEKYGFEPPQEWLDHLRLSSARFNDGGSGSFVSPNGLVLTNHHVALGQLQKVSTPEKDYVKDGFHARRAADELKAPDLELNVLMEMENVTERVNQAAKPDGPPAQALEARKAVIAAIEKESLDKTGLRSDVVTLYQGGEYWLYRYKRYTDVRLVFAPEQPIAFFGGDPDNFTFPRFDLDFALVRVYENGKPVESRHFLTWSPKGPEEGELVFVSGHPGSTDRLETLARLETLRDVNLPGTLEIIERRLAVLRDYEKQGAEQARQAQGQIFRLENAHKALSGELRGLRDPEIWAKKARDEEEFRAKVNANPEWKKTYGNAWDEIAAAEAKERKRLATLARGSFASSPLAAKALSLVRYVEETKKPDAERLEEFREAQQPALELQLFSAAPVYPAFEEVLLTGALQFSLEKLGPDDPYIKAALQGRSPAEVAKEVMGGTKLGDAETRKALAKGGSAAIEASSDPLIAFARRIDPVLRADRKVYEEEIESVVKAAGEKIGRARFAVFGKTAYPDATFTLRLSFGTVKGYPMNGTQAPFKTTFYGLYDRAHSFNFKPPHHVPQRYLVRKNALNLATGLNFVSTNDIIGGNSGSPVVNRHGELVGLVFDGNIESLVGNFVYDERSNRAVSVHSEAIVHVLRVVYDAASLADELEGKAARPVTRR